MSYYQDIFSISVRGPKAGVIRMLNAAVCNVGTGDAVLPADDLDTINRKIEAACLRVNVTDLLDGECLKDGIIQAKKLAFEEKVGHWHDILDGKVSFANKGDEVDAKDEAADKLDCLCDGRIIDVLEVRELDGDYELRLEFYVGEEYFTSPDWADWEDVCRLYGCRVIIDDDEFRNGGFNRLCGTTIYEMKDGGVEKKQIEPELAVEKYVRSLDLLCSIDPQHYRKKKIRDMEARVRALQAEIDDEKLMVLLDNLDSTDGRLEVPEGVTHLSGEICAYGEKLRSIFIPASVDTINKMAISGSRLESIEISPDNPSFCSVNNCILDKAKTRLLIGCKNSVVPDGILEIEDSAFSSCAGLQEITIPASTRRVGSHAFSRCTALSRVVIEEGLETLGYCAFMDCPSLPSIVLPNTLKNLPCRCFYGCKSLKDVTLPEAPEYVDENVFEKTPYAGDMDLYKNDGGELPFL